MAKDSTVALVALGGAAALTVVLTRRAMGNAPGTPGAPGAPGAPGSPGAPGTTDLLIQGGTPDYLTSPSGGGGSNTPTTTQETLNQSTETTTTTPVPGTQSPISESQAKSIAKSYCITNLGLQAPGSGVVSSVPLVGGVYKVSVLGNWSADGQTAGFQWLIGVDRSNGKVVSAENVAPASSQTLAPMTTTATTAPTTTTTAPAGPPTNYWGQLDGATRSRIDSGLGATNNGTNTPQYPYLREAVATRVVGQISLGVSPSRYQYIYPIEVDYQLAETYPGYPPNVPHTPDPYTLAQQSYVGKGPGTHWRSRPNPGVGFAAFRSGVANARRINGVLG